MPLISFVPRRMDSDIIEPRTLCHFKEDPHRWMNIRDIFSRITTMELLFILIE